MFGLEPSLVIVRARQMATPLLHGYTVESTVSIRLILFKGTGVSKVIACKVVCFCQP